MPNEETPLLQSVVSKHDALYERFSPRRKRAILLIVSWSGLLPLFAAGCFVPSVSSIAVEFHSTPSIISLAVSLSVLTNAFASLVLSTYAGYYGRRIIYLLSLPVFVAGSVAVASAADVPQLMTFRILQAIGSSGGISLGAGVIGDIFKIEERGQAMGIFFAAVLVAPAVAPLAGGIAAAYASWRWMQLILAIMGLISFITILIWLPETSHPGATGSEKSGTRGLVLLNPFKGLLLLRSPNLMLVSLSGAAVLVTDYVLLIPLAFTIGSKYHITNPALVGLCFLPLGLGNIIGAPLAGILSDRLVVKHRALRGGVWVPEDRLRGTLVGTLLTAGSVFASGIFVEYVDGPIGLVLNMLALFVNGIGVDFVLSPSSAYFVDVLHSQSSEAMASGAAFRSFIIAATSGGVIPMIERYGIVTTNTLAALSALIFAYGALWATIKYGERMRASVDVGYSTSEDN